MASLSGSGILRLDLSLNGRPSAEISGWVAEASAASAAEAFATNLSHWFTVT